MEVDEIYAMIKKKYPDFTIDYYKNTILTQENLEKYGVDVLFTLASEVNQEAQNILEGEQETSEPLSFEEIERRVKQEDTSIFLQEIKDFIHNKDGILQYYDYFAKNSEWALLGFHPSSLRIKILQQLKENGVIENYKQIEKVAREKYLTFLPTSCLLLSDAAMQIFSEETIIELNANIQWMFQKPLGRTNFNRGI